MTPSSLLSFALVAASCAVEAPPLTADPEPAAPTSASDTPAPIGPTGPDLLPAAAPEPERINGDWAIFETQGGSFRHPAAWDVQSLASGLELIPGDHLRGDEWIVVGATPAPGVRDAKANGVGRALDAMVGASFPGFSRKRAPKAIPAGAGREGARYDYSGVAPDGRSAFGSIYVLVEGEQAAWISVAASRTALRKRRATVEEIFRSFTSSTPAPGRTRPVAAGENADTTAKGLDPRLIGMFAGEAIHSSNGTYVNTQLVYALGGDGVLHYGARSSINAAQADGGGGFKWTATGSSAGNVKRGRWSTQGDRLTVRWDTGALTTLRYGFEPDGTLALRNAVTGKLINIYSRAH